MEGKSINRLKNTRRVHKAQREGGKDEGLGVTSGSLELPHAGRVQKGAQTAAHHQRWHPGVEGAWI